ncbi:MAG: hypothetical protein KAR19_02930 [Bacteroidales bacterium]|nr:hypothetical protein [Bacteroidales bacterium]
MDPSDFNRLLNTDHYSPADLEEISGLCRNYPMFNLAHMLKVRISEVLGQDKEPDLKVAAIYSSDRKKLFQLVNEVVKPQLAEEATLPEEPAGIQFSDEPHQQADVIIEQHAPYASTGTDDDLLELDEEASEEPVPDHSQETLVIDEVKPEKIISKNNRLIRSFIHDEPGPIRADKQTGIKEDVSLSSIREHDGFITDTLAQIYVKQGLYAKAVYAYEKLSLKYPEKSAYFAAQIEKIKNINHS